MPSRAPRICACGRVVAHGEICPCRAKAAAERKARHDQRRPNSSQRGYDSRWEKTAKAFLVSHPTCPCGAPAVLVRHRISIRLRPDLRLDPSNWLPGCAKCNARDAARERRKP